MEMQRLQEAGFGEEYDYRIGSPHLRHWKLYDTLVTVLRNTVRGLSSRGMPLTVLEVGAGHGGYTEPALAQGCRVTATEMSRPSVERLRKRFGTNENLSVVFDKEGSLAQLGDQRFSLVLCVSLLHHIPDYLSFIDRAISDHLLPGGAFLSVQDPLWYPSLRRSTRYFEKLAYSSWRLTRGNLVVGAHTFIRRLRGIYDVDNPADMVEYHVVRQGVDHERIIEAIAPRFEQCSLMTYWSTQAPLWQSVGAVLNIKNTFAVCAEDYSGRVTGLSGGDPKGPPHG